MKKEDREKMLEEVLGRRRTTGELSGVSFDTLKSAEEDLNKILEKNQRELDELTKNFEYSDDVFKKLQQEVEKDFGVKAEVPEKAIITKIDDEVYSRIENNLKQAVIGQDEAVEQLMIAIKRPYVIGCDIAKIRNSIILTGSNGTGRHGLIEKAAKELKKEGLITDSNVCYLDMSRYNTTSFEVLFLQDLYVALQSKSSFIIIENFEEANAIFNRMLANLVIDGKCLLNKRYTFAGNQLQEVTTQLSNDIIDSLDGNNKILVFVSENKPSKMMDFFGTSFLDKIVDKIATTKLSDESLKIIIDQLIDELLVKSLNQLDIKLTVEDNVKDYIRSLYQPDDGMDSLSPIVDKIYHNLVEIALANKVSEASIKLEDEKIIIHYNDTQKELEIIASYNAEREAIQAELDEIVGLEPVKEYLLSLENHLKVNQIRKQKGLKTSEISKHMVFTGNPGTGKTTIARLVSRMMKACNILKQGQLVEVTRADLVGKYVGHTAPLTMSVIQSALGGVLFIDEAYSLYRGKDDSFGLEAIDTLVKGMEDHRDDLIVILAGYSREMSEFLTANSGLKSRFANIINFPDYTGTELMLISKSVAKGKDYRIDDAALKPLEDYFTMIQARADYTSGNGRLARNLVEEAILNQSKRLLEQPDAELDLLLLEDFNLKEDIE